MITDQIFEGPSCTLCGAAMVLKCLSCGSTPELTPVEIVMETDESADLYSVLQRLENIPYPRFF